MAKRSKMHMKVYIHYVSTMKESEQKLFQNEIWDFA